MVGLPEVPLEQWILATESRFMANRPNGYCSLKSDLAVNGNWAMSLIFLILWGLIPFSSSSLR